MKFGVAQRLCGPWPQASRALGLGLTLRLQPWSPHQAVTKEVNDQWGNAGHEHIEPVMGRGGDTRRLVSITIYGREDAGEERAEPQVEQSYSIDLK